jgi:hypothetical protein
MRAVAKLHSARKSAGSANPVASFNVLIKVLDIK